MNAERVEHCKRLLLGQGVNPASTVAFDVNGTVHIFSFQEIIQTYLLASDEAQRVFIVALSKTMDTDSTGIQKFFEGMGQLLLISRLSSQDMTSIS